ncbi:MAG: DinB family protein [Gemmatimonadota bacterium]
MNALVQVLDQVYDRRGWQGTTLKGALRGVTPEQATWRPAPRRHNIWELMLHAAYWKFMVRRRITGDRTLVFPRQGADWPRIAESANHAEWRKDLACLGEEHQLLRRAVERLPAGELRRKSGGSRWTNLEQIHGVAAHDAYHTGQIQLLKRLWITRSPGARL